MKKYFFTICVALEGIGRYQLEITDTDTTTRYHKNRPIPPIPILKYRYITSYLTISAKSLNVVAYNALIVIALQAKRINLLGNVGIKTTLVGFVLTMLYLILEYIFVSCIY